MTAAPHPGFAAAALLAGLVAAASPAGGRRRRRGALPAALPRGHHAVGRAAGGAQHSVVAAARHGFGAGPGAPPRVSWPAADHGAGGGGDRRPTIVIVFGLVAVHGRAGWANAALSALGLPAPAVALYGLHGVVLAHVLMNAPLVARVMLNAFASLPAEQVRLAHMLRFGAADCFRHLDCRRSGANGRGSPRSSSCSASPASRVITLGGGPANATLEAAIYQALRVEVDFARAASIATLQIALCMAFVAAFGLFGARLPEMAGLRAPQPRPDRGSLALKALDGIVIVLALLLIAPVLASLAAGAAHLAALADADVVEAALTSALIAALAPASRSGSPCCWRARPPARRKAVPRHGARAASISCAGADRPAALRAGGGPLRLAPAVRLAAAVGLVLVPLVNGLMALPFVYRLVAPPLRQSARSGTGACGEPRPDRARAAAHRELAPAASPACRRAGSRRGAVARGLRGHRAVRRRRSRDAALPHGRAHGRLPHGRGGGGRAAARRGRWRPSYAADRA